MLDEVKELGDAVQTIIKYRSKRGRRRRMGNTGNTTIKPTMVRAAGKVDVCKDSDRGSRADTLKKAKRQKGK